MLLYTSDEQFMVKAEISAQAEYFIKSTTICDRDEEGKLLGMEVFLYEANIDLSKMKEQFLGSHNVEINDDDLMYITFRLDHTRKHGTGFGRRAKVGITKEGLFSLLILDWNAPGAGTPFVDRFIALEGLEYIEGFPK